MNHECPVKAALKLCEPCREDVEKVRTALLAWVRYHEDPDGYPVTEKAPWLLTEEALGITVKDPVSGD